MRRWIALSAKLYPRRWRERYGPEFDALMQDVEPDWRELADVLGGAVKMQLKNDRAYWKLASLMAILGAVAAVGVSFRLPDRYVSSATLRLTPPPQADNNEATERFEQIKQEILSRNSLAEMIQRPSLMLYSGEKQRMPMEDVVARMRSDIQIRKTPAAGGAPQTINISFTYPDLVKAEEVAVVLTTRFVETSAMKNRNRVAMWRNAWQEDPPPAETLEVIARPSDPRKTGGPNRLAFLAVGLFAGVLIASCLRWPKPALRLAAFALAGCALAAAGSYLLADRYTSTAVLRIVPPLDLKRWFGSRHVVPLDEHLHRIEQALLSDASLTELIQRPSLYLYEKDRAKIPMAEVVRRMRDRDIRIEMQPPMTFFVSFTYGDREKAQAVVREFVTGFTERNIIAEREQMKTEGPEFHKMADLKIGQNLEVLDPASLPQMPVSPNRGAIAGAGLGVGLAIGIAVVARRRPSDPRLGSAVATPAG